MRLVAASPADAPAMAGTHAESFEDGWSAADIAALLASPGAFAFLVRDEADAVRAFALARAAVDEAELLTLAVAPDARRRGLGAALVEAGAPLGVGRGGLPRDRGQLALGARGPFVVLAQDLELHLRPAAPRELAHDAV